jgi:predicted SnoaL-like aldol condensation-catalyzing enzyme
MNKIIAIIILAAIGGAAMAALSVVPSGGQSAMLASDDPLLAKNKRIAYEFFRVVLFGWRLDQGQDYMHEDYIQHNPNVDTGMTGLIDFIRSHMGDDELPPVSDELPGLVAIQAEGDYVTLSFVRECEGNGQPYSTTWFDMFRIEGDKIAEHWDTALMGAGSEC